MIICYKSSKKAVLMVDGCPMLIQLLEIELRYYLSIVYFSLIFLSFKSNCISFTIGFCIKLKVLLGFSVSAHCGTIGAHININPELSECGGFTVLEHLFSCHFDKPQCYLAMFSIFVGQPVTNINLADDFSLDLIWSNVFGLSPSR